jgi:hypothetical protein
MIIVSMTAKIIEPPILFSNYKKIYSINCPLIKRMEFISELIGQSKILIAADDKNELMGIAIMIEDFIKEENVVSDMSFEDNTFYTQHVYMGHEFYSFIDGLKNKLIPLVKERLNVKLTFVDFIYNYISELKCGNYHVLKIYKIDYNSNFNKNNNLNVSYVMGKSRFTNNNVKYLHYKYYLEETYRKLYSPEYHESWVELERERKRLLGEMMSELPKMSANKRMVGGSKKKRSKIYSATEKYCYKSDYDGEIAIAVGTEKNVPPIKAILENMCGKVDLFLQVSKSIFDPRIKAVVFKHKTNTIMKMWIIPDHELIPVINRSVHIDVSIRLCLNEYLSSEMLRSESMSRVKLMLFGNMIKKRNKMIIDKILADPSKCKYIGVYCPMNITLKMIKLERQKKLTDYKKSKKVSEVVLGV